MNALLSAREWSEPILDLSTSSSRDDFLVDFLLDAGFAFGFVTALRLGGGASRVGDADLDLLRATKGGMMKAATVHAMLARSDECARGKSEAKQ